MFVDIIGYEGKYKINEDGDVYSVKRNIILSKCKNSIGYYVVVLSDSDNKRKQYTVHRLLAINFLKHINGKRCVNHIDGNKENNKISNLEWCSYSDNLQHAYDIGLRKRMWSKNKEDRKQHTKVKYVINQYDKTTLELIASFNSLRIASECTKIDQRSISQVYCGSKKSAGGFVWEKIISQND